jgi:hypothetical protein
VGHAAYLEVKTEGKHSMLRKQEPPEDVYGMFVLQDPRAMVKATLPEPQFPEVQVATPRSPRLLRGHRQSRYQSGIVKVRTSYRKVSGRWAMGNEPIQGNEQGTYSALERQKGWNYGIAYGARALWRRSPHSSLRAGKPLTWRRGTGVAMTEHEGARDA